MLSRGRIQSPVCMSWTHLPHKFSLGNWLRDSYENVLFCLCYPLKYYKLLSTNLTVCSRCQERADTNSMQDSETSYILSHWEAFLLFLLPRDNRAKKSYEFWVLLFVLHHQRSTERWLWQAWGITCTHITVSLRPFSSFVEEQNVICQSALCTTLVCCCYSLGVRDDSWFSCMRIGFIEGKRFWAAFICFGKNVCSCVPLEAVAAVVSLV